MIAGKISFGLKIVSQMSNLAVPFSLLFCSFSVFFSFFLENVRIGAFIRRKKRAANHVRYKWESCRETIGMEEIKRGTMINASPAFKPVNHRQVFFYRADTMSCFLSRGARYTPRLFVLVARTKDNDPPLLSKMERNHDLENVSFLWLQCAILRKPRRK